jgi:hypothetical protein
MDTEPLELRECGNELPDTPHKAIKAPGDYDVEGTAARVVHPCPKSRPILGDAHAIAVHAVKLPAALLGPLAQGTSCTLGFCLKAPPSRAFKLVGTLR